MGLHPGQTNNPNGRPEGARNRRTAAVLDLIDERGDRDPIDIASEKANDATLSPEQRAPYVKLVADYKHSKMGAAVPRSYLTEPIEPPFVPPKSFHEINQNKAYLDGLWNAGRLDLASYNRACASQQEYANNIEAELKQIQAQGGASDQTIRIQGGLLPLPGTDVIMDDTAVGRVNGNNGNVIDHMPSNDSENGQNVTQPLPTPDEPPTNPLVNNANTS
jgi:hypothetical protein